MSDRQGDPMGDEQVDDQIDERFVEFLRKAAAEYNEPPETPREEMWSRIEASVLEPTLSRIAADYHAPPETPRDEMWERIEAAWQFRASAPDNAREAGFEPLAPVEIGEIGEVGEAVAWRETVAVAETERTRRMPRITPWAWGLAVAASLTIGVVIGRQTTGELERGPAVADATQTVSADPGAGTESRESPGEVGSRARPRPNATYRAATVQHLSRTEAFLTSFRTGAGQSEEDGEVSRWARSLLADTRLLLDWPADRDPRMTVLLQELELVLAQIAQLGGRAPEGERSLIMEDLQSNNVLPRLRSAIPAGPVAITQSGV